MRADDGIKTIPLRQEPAEAIYVHAFSTRGLRFVNQPIGQHPRVSGDCARQRGDFLYVGIRAKCIQKIPVELCDSAMAAEGVGQKDQQS